MKKKFAQNGVYFYAMRKCFTLAEWTHFCANFFFSEKFVQLYASIFHTYKSRDWFQLFIYLLFSPEISDWFQLFIDIKKFFNFFYTCKCWDRFKFFIYVIFSPEIWDWFQFFIYIKNFFNYPLKPRISILISILYLSTNLLTAV